MASPHSSLPSPTLSASSHHQSQSFSALSAMQQPARASSALSGMSGVSHGSQGHSPTPDEVSQPPLSAQAPMQLYPGGPGFPNAIPSAFLPQVTSSPPPQTPAYIPPPQHAMAPDPIHLMQSWGQDQWRAGPSQYQQRFGRASVAGGPMQQPVPPNPADGYPRAMSIGGGGIGLHNPAIQHAMMNGHRPGSAQSRRRRDRDDERDRDEDEVISTIFVVGFPDDMQEREFANLFTFASGFEAATLKFPSGSRHREPTAALLAELQQLAAMQQEHGDQQPLEEAIAALQLSGTASTSSSTTPSAAISMTPSAPNGPVLGGPSMPTRRQTIGFARFRSRAEALAAKDLLQGRKIDTLTGSTLKAEMAKKNLHTKRGTTSEEVLGLLLRSGRLAGLVNQAGGVPGMSGTLGGPVAAPQAAQSAKEAWDSFDREPTQLSQARDDAERSRGHHASMTHNAVAPQASSNSAVPSSSAPNPGLANPTPAPAPAPNTFNSFPPYNAPNQPSAQSNASASPPLSAKSPSTRPTDSKALLALAEEADEMEGWSVGMNVGMGMMDGYQPRRPERASQSGARPIGVSMGMYQAMSGHGLPGTQQQGYGAYGTSPPGGSDHMSETGRSMGALSNTNPADQNPPINTLYVGNLPAISPPTHPPNFLEESLRSLFSRCQGYKRMSFRQKINGPMCFVEFEDVPYAAQAIQELYGHTLGGLVKGGIRLSYSKNSLGQRGNAHQQGINNSLFGGIAHTVALAGMSQPTSATSPSYPTHSAPIPMPQAPMDRRTSDSTSLSPTAAPFTALSPRSRYFDNGPSPSAFPSSAASNTSGLGNGAAGLNGGNGNGNGSGYPSFPSSANSNHSSLGSAGTAPAQTASAASTSAPGPGPGAGGNGHFSPVASPIRTPASFAWLSSNGPMGGSGYAFEPSPFNNPVGAGVGSLNGAANAWAQGPSPH